MIFGKMQRGVAVGVLGVSVCTLCQQEGELRCVVHLGMIVERGAAVFVFYIDVGTLFQQPGHQLHGNVVEGEGGFVKCIAIVGIGLALAKRGFEGV